MLRRFLSFLVAVCVSFMSVVLPISAFAQTIPSVAGPFSPYPPYSNPWLSDGWSSNNPRTVSATSSGGASVIRQGVASVVKDGITVKIPVTAAVSLERAALAKSVALAAASGLAGPYGVALALAIEFGRSKGVFECENYGWCKAGSTTRDDGGPAGRYWSSGENETQFSTPEAACASQGLPYATFNGASSYYCDAVANSPDHTSGKIAYVRTGVCQPGYSLSGDKCLSDKPPPNLPSSPPYSDPAFPPWLDTGAGSSNSGPKLYDAARAGGGQPENPAVAGPSASGFTSPGASSEPTITNRTTVTNSDGTTSTQTTTKRVDVQLQTTGNNTANNNVTNYATNTTTTVTTTNNSTGATTTSVSQDNPGLSPNQNTPAEPQPEDKGPRECGTPGKPRCQIDETDTPTSADTAKVGSEITAAVSQTQEGAIAAITDNQDLDRNSSTAWQFGFNLPSGCTPYPMFLNIVLDYCRFQPVIHDVMSMVWYGSSFFTIAGMFGRAAREG